MMGSILLTFSFVWLSLSLVHRNCILSFLFVQVQLVEQDLITLPEHLIPWFFISVRVCCFVMCFVYLQTLCVFYGDLRFFFTTLWNIMPFLNILSFSHDNVRKGFIFYLFMKRKFKKWWLKYPAISIKQTTI